MNSKKMKVAKIVISALPIPNSKGSWTQLLEYLFSKNSDADFYLISKIPGKEKSAFFNQIYFYEIPFVKRFRYYHLFKRVSVLLKSYDNVVLSVMDNIKISNQLFDFVSKNKLNNKVKILFFQHGFSYHFSHQAAEQFYMGIDTMVLLTKESYKFEKNLYSSYPSKVSILGNPINYNGIISHDSEEVDNLKTELGIQNKYVYLWLAADRKKKGLDLVLTAWSKTRSAGNDSVLIVVGNSTDRQEQENVIFKGYIPHLEVYKYFALADVYLFPTLYKEGFSLSLTEAAASGCFIIASDYPSEREVLQNTNNKLLIEMSNSEEAWQEGILRSNERIRYPDYKRESNTSFLNYEQWSEKFHEIFKNISGQY